LNPRPCHQIVPKSLGFGSLGTWHNHSSSRFVSGIVRRMTNIMHPYKSNHADQQENENWKRQGEFNSRGPSARAGVRGLSAPDRTNTSAWFGSDDSF